MRITLASALLLVLMASPAHAGEDSHERARRAVEAGEILPLETILSQVRQSFQGEFIEAELEREHGRMVYEIKLIGPDGHVAKLILDARDGSLLKTKGRATGKGARDGEGRR